MSFLAKGFAFCYGRGMRPYVVWAVLRKEVAAGWASPRFQLSAWLIVLLSVVVSVTSAGEYASRRALWELLDQESEERLRVYTWSALSPVLLREPEPLALFAQGFDARLGRQVAISLFTVPRQASGDYRGNDFTSYLNDLDLTTVVGVVLGFSALLLAFDAFTQERERRNGKHLAVAGVKPFELFLGKYLGLGFLLSLPLGLAVATSLVLFTGKGLLPLDASTLPRLGGLLATYVLYLSLLVLLGLTASLVSSSGSQALSRLLFVWLVFFLAVPSVALNLGRDDLRQREAERAVERQAARWDAADREEIARAEERDPLLAEFSGHRSVYQMPDPEDRHVRFVRYGTAPFYDALARLVEKERALGRATALREYAAHERVTARRRERERRAQTTSLVSPAYVFDRIAESFAATAADDYDRFLAACRSYRSGVFLPYLEKKGAFRTWRWFTDDTLETLQPWPSFLDRTPDDASLKDPAAIKQLYSPPASTAMDAHIARANQDPARILPVTDLPRFAYARPGWKEAVRRVWPELSWILLLHLGLLAVVLVWIRAGRDVFGVRA